MRRVLPPLFAESEQQIEFKNQAETHRYILGEIIWATDSRSTIADSGSQFLVIAGCACYQEQGP